jgi:hypothetical protein
VMTAVFAANLIVKPSMFAISYLATASVAL